MKVTQSLGRRASEAGEIQRDLGHTISYNGGEEYKRWISEQKKRKRAGSVHAGED